MEPLTMPISEFTKNGVGRTKTYELIREGKLDVVKIGRRTLITYASARRVLTGQAA